MKKMKKKLTLLLIAILTCICMGGCTAKKDWVTVHGRSSTVFDNFDIVCPDGYYYSEYEKTTIDDHTVALTIYFTKLEDDSWE